MHTSELNKFWHQLWYFFTNVWSGANWKFMQLVHLQISWVYTQVITQEGLHKQGKLKLININFTILNSHVTVVYLRFIIFYCGKTEKLLYWLFSSKKIVKTKWHLSKSLTFQNLLKKYKTITSREVWKHLGFWQRT